MSAITYPEKDPMEEAILKIVLLFSRAKNEVSNYARLLFQENTIQLLLISSLRTVELYSSREKHAPKIAFNYKRLEKKTLGALLEVLSPFLSDNMGLEKKIKDFIRARNNITHKITKFKNWDEIESRASSAVALGDEAISGLNEFKTCLYEKIIVLK